MGTHRQDLPHRRTMPGGPAAFA